MIFRFGMVTFCAKNDYAKKRLRRVAFFLPILRMLLGFENPATIEINKKQQTVLPSAESIYNRIIPIGIAPFVLNFVSGCGIIRKNG